MWIFLKVLLLTWSTISLDPQYDCVEYFAGKAEASAALREDGFCVASYDVEYCGKSMDFLQPGGYTFPSCNL